MASIFDILSSFMGKSTVSSPEDEEQEQKRKDTVQAGASVSSVQSAQVSAQEAARKFAKPDVYDRSLLEDPKMMRAAKQSAFQNGNPVDPYTGQELELTMAEARAKYGADYMSHVAQPDHIVPLEERYQQTKNNPWLSNDDIKLSSNRTERLKVVSGRYNNAKRNCSNSDFVSDDQYLAEKKVHLTKDGKSAAIQDEKAARAALQRDDALTSFKNIAETGHKAGIRGAKSAGVTTLTISGAMNIAAVFRGEKSAEDAIVDVAGDTVKGAATGYIMSDGLTVLSHTLSSSSSPFLSALGKSNVPGQVITAVILVGNSLQRYGSGEISTQEFLMELGEKGLSFATTSYAMVVGQTLIPIPIVGGAVGALIGATLSSECYKQLMDTLRRNDLEHQERLRIIAECKRASEEMRRCRAELEMYLQNYFYDYQNCFDNALNSIQSAFACGDIDGIIAGANTITRKLGGTVYYDNMEEFKSFFLSDSVDTF